VEDSINWLHVISALLGGGAAGAIISAIVSAYRARRQPIGRRVNVLPVFRQSGGPSTLRAQIAIMQDSDTITFENLFLAEVQIVNRGNSDIEEFEFGATLGDGDLCIHVESSPSDRHHQILEQTLVTPQEPKQEIDFKLKPFNRGDSYSFKLYLVIPPAQEEPRNIELGSSSPIKFVDMASVVEILASATATTVFMVGPLRLSFDPKHRRR